MFVKVTVLNLKEKDQEYLINQYAARGLKAVAYGDTVVLETEDTFERCMIYMAMGQQFPDYEVRLSQRH